MRTTTEDAEDDDYDRYVYAHNIIMVIDYGACVSFMLMIHS